MRNRFAIAGFVSVLIACSSSSSQRAIDPAADAGLDAAVSTDAGAADATSEASASSCEGSCRVTSIVATFGAQKRTLVRAQFGTQAGDAGTELHTESHLGGAEPCPTAQSPTPDYTLVVSAIPSAPPGGRASRADGVTAAFFDFKGDLGLPPLTKATSVDVSNVLLDPSASPAWVAFDVKATFAEGAIDGHLYAAYCSSLSQ